MTTTELIQNSLLETYLDNTDVILEDIESIECEGMFEDEKVYDIEVADDSHTFMANDILVHNSLYSCYDQWVRSIEGSENMSKEQIRDLIVKFNTGFFDHHNREFMDKYYESRHCQSIHNFELETVAYSDVRLNVKKRYAQLLIWKDGYCPDVDSLPLKSKGLELIKASYPRLARNGLKKIVRVLLESNNTGIALQHELNKVLNEQRQIWMTCPVEDVCENKSVANYTKYILDDENPYGVQVALKCPYHVRALANRNWTIKKYGFRSELQYGGKMKIYICRKRSKKDPDSNFAFMAGEHEDWMEQYWPVDRMACFQKFFIDPMNRILESIGENQLNISGTVNLNLFDL